jgi:hypothetical protein
MVHFDEEQVIGSFFFEEPMVIGNIYSGCGGGHCFVSHPWGNRFPISW